MNNIHAIDFSQTQFIMMLCLIIYKYIIFPHIFVHIEVEVAPRWLISFISQSQWKKISRTSKLPNIVSGLNKSIDLFLLFFSTATILR